MNPIVLHNKKENTNFQKTEEAQKEALTLENTYVLLLVSFLSDIKVLSFETSVSMSATLGVSLSSLIPALVLISVFYFLGRELFNRSIS
jgi:hypothetical protein